MPRSQTFLCFSFANKNGSWPAKLVKLQETNWLETEEMIVSGAWGQSGTTAIQEIILFI